MITSEKIEAWVREAEERPSSAPLLIRIIANRLNEAAKWNEELLAENLQLRSGKKSEEYEARIANLEYQVDLLKRQVDGEAILPPSSAGRAETQNVLLYTPEGRVLRVEAPPQGWDSPGAIASFGVPIPPEMAAPRLLIAPSHEELLFIFDTGRTITSPVAAIPAAEPGRLQWDTAFLQMPLGSETLAALLPIGKMALFNSAVQVSRKGFVKNIKGALLQGYIGKGFVGSGVKQPADKTLGLTPCAAEDALVLVSREGWSKTLAAARLPATIEEALRLNVTDHLVAAFALGDHPSVAFVTTGGKVIHRQPEWLEPGEVSHARGQAVFSAERRAAGVRLCGAAALSPNLWTAALTQAGEVFVLRAAALLEQGSLGLGDVEILDFYAQPL